MFEAAPGRDLAAITREALSSPDDSPSLAPPPGVVLYRWRLDSDGLAGSGDVARGFAAFPAAALATGEGFAAFVAADSERTRAEAIRHALDAGPGASYRARYRLVAPDGASVEVEDCGRWRAGTRGRPALAEGLMILTPGAAPAPAAAAKGGDARAWGRRAAALAIEAARRGGAGAPIAALVVVADFDGVPSPRRAEAFAAQGARLLRAGDRLIRIDPACLVLVLRADEAQARETARRLAAAVGEDAGIAAEATRIGLALSPRDARGARALLQRAEAALIRLRPGENGLTPPARRRSPRSAPRALIDALNQSRVVLAERPLAALKPGLAELREAAAQIVDRRGATLPASSWAELEDHPGLAALIDARALELAFHRLEAAPGLRLVLRIAAASLCAPDWLAAFDAFAAAEPAAAARLTLEAPERAFASVEAAAAARRIARRGARLAVGDYLAQHLDPHALATLGVGWVRPPGALSAAIDRALPLRQFLRDLTAATATLGIAAAAGEGLGAAAAETFGFDYRSVEEAWSVSADPPRRRRPRRARGSISPCPAFSPPGFPAVAAYR